MLKTAALLLTLTLFSACRFPLSTTDAKDAAIRLMAEAVLRALPPPQPQAVPAPRAPTPQLVRCPRLHRRIAVTS